MSVLSELEFAQYVFLEEEEPCSWDRSCGVSDGRNGVSCYGAAIASEDRVCMDNEEFGIHTARMFSDLQCWD